MEKHIKCLHRVQELEAENGRFRLFLAASPVHQAVTPRSPARQTVSQKSSSARPLFQSSPSGCSANISGQGRDDWFCQDDTVIHVNSPVNNPTDHSPLLEQHDVVASTSPALKGSSLSTSQWVGSQTSCAVEVTAQTNVSDSFNRRSVPIDAGLLHSLVDSPPRAESSLESPQQSGTFSTSSKQSLSDRLDNLQLHYAEKVCHVVGRCAVILPQSEAVVYRNVL